MPEWTEVERASFEELRHILRWTQSQLPRRPEACVLVGGWAVYAYNPYLPSIDIDLVLSSKIRARLMNWLRKNRRFERWRPPGAEWQGVRKRAPNGEWVHVDTASRSEEYHFEGRDETLNFDVIAGHVQVEAIDKIEIAVPERGLMVLFKLKAAHDRKTRLKNGASDDPSWEMGKLVKDRSDILSLLDREAGGDAVSVAFLGNQLRTFPFLVEVLREVGRDPDAASRYGRIPPEQCADLIESTVRLLT